MANFSNVAAAGDELVHVGEPVGERIGHLLHRRGACVPHVRARDRDRIEARRRRICIENAVGDQPHRRPHREDPGAACDVLLEDVVLDRAGQLVPRDALLVGVGDVHGVDDRRGAVDGEGRGYLGKIDPREQRLHFGEIGERYADFSDLRTGHRVGRVVAALGRQVEGDREPGLAARKEELVALIGLLGRGEAGVLAHRPQSAAIAVGEDAAREGISARQFLPVRTVTVVRAGGDQRQPDAGGSAHRSGRRGGRIGRGLVGGQHPRLLLTFIDPSLSRRPNGPHSPT